MITPDHTTWSAVVLDLHEFFDQHVEAGVTIDAALCTDFADGLQQLFEAVAAFEALAAAMQIPTTQQEAGWHASLAEWAAHVADRVEGYSGADDAQFLVTAGELRALRRCVDAVLGRAAPPSRSIAERRALARSAAPVTSDGRVVAFPVFRGAQEVALAEEARR